MQTERAELVSKLEDLKKRLESVRGRNFRRRTAFSEDAATVQTDGEGVAVFKIALELDQTWSQLEVLDHATRTSLHKPPSAPKPSLRPPQREPPRFRMPETWEETATFLIAVLTLDLRSLPRSDVRLLREIAALRRQRALLWSMDAYERSLSCIVWRADHELRLRPFDVVVGAAGGDGKASATLRLVDARREDDVD